MRPHEPVKRSDERAVPTLLVPDPIKSGRGVRSQLKLALARALVDGRAMAIRTGSPVAAAGCQYAAIAFFVLPRG